MNVDPQKQKGDERRSSSSEPPEGSSSVGQFSCLTGSVAELSVRSDNISKMSRKSDSGVSMKSDRSMKVPPISFECDIISKSDLVQAWLDQLEITSEEGMETVGELLKDISTSVEQRKNCEIQLRKLAQELMPAGKKLKSEYIGSMSLGVGAVCLIGTFLLRGRPAASLFHAAAAAAATTYILVSLRTALTRRKLRNELILLLKNDSIQEGINHLLEATKKTEEQERQSLSKDEAAVKVRL